MSQQQNANNRSLSAHNMNQPPANLPSAGLSSVQHPHHHRHHHHHNIASHHAAMQNDMMAMTQNMMNNHMQMTMNMGMGMGMPMMPMMPMMGGFGSMGMGVGGMGMGMGMGGFGMGFEDMDARMNQMMNMGPSNHGSSYSYTSVTTSSGSQNGVPIQKSFYSERVVKDGVEEIKEVRSDDAQGVQAARHARFIEGRGREQVRIQRQNEKLEAVENLHNIQLGTLGLNLFGKQCISFYQHLWLTRPEAFSLVILSLLFELSISSCISIYRRS